jgi:hypothetical protein
MKLRENNSALFPINLALVCINLQLDDATCIFLY